MATQAAQTRTYRTTRRRFFSPKQTFASIAERPSWLAPLLLMAILRTAVSVLLNTPGTSFAIVFGLWGIWVLAKVAWAAVWIAALLHWRSEFLV